MKALKWIAVLPSSIITLFLANAIWRVLHSMTTIQFLDPDSWLNLIIVEFMSSLISAASFVYVGALIAPSYKKETAIVLTILIGMFFRCIIFCCKHYNNDIPFKYWNYSRAFWGCCRLF